VGSAKAKIAAIGLRPKTGRAIAVVLRGPVEAVEIIERVELKLVDPQIRGTYQPYHQVMELPWSEALLKAKPLVRAIEKVAVKAIAELARELKSQKLTIAGVAIAGPVDRDLTKIGNYHIRAHAAEGLLFRDVLQAAAATNKLKYQCFAERSLPEQAATALGLPATEINERLTMLGRAIGPPWRADQRAAALSAWIALARV